MVLQPLSKMQTQGEERSISFWQATIYTVACKRVCASNGIALMCHEEICTACAYHTDTP